VVVAVVAIRMMQMTLHQVINVIPVRNRLVTAANSMLMRFVMTTTSVLGRADVGILIANLKSVLINTTCMGMMQMPVVNVIDMPVML
jgi:hypothetical protein